MEQKIAAVDQDATIIESRKREGLYTYEGSRGYQPMLAVWAEMDVGWPTSFAILEVPESGWKAYGKPEPDVDRECAEVVFVSNEELEPKGAKPLRYVAIRLRRRQGGLFANGSSVLHFVVLSDIWDWEPARLIEWHREKAGTIEGAHDVLKNELATGVCRRNTLGPTPAWLRLAVISYNVLTALKRLAAAQS